MNENIVQLDANEDTFVNLLDKCIQTFHTAFNAYVWDATKYVEEIPVPKPANASAWVEMRLNGPRITAISRSNTKIYVDISILNTCVYNEKNPLFIRHINNQSIDFFLNTVFSVPGYDCFQLNNDGVKANFFGYVDTNIKMMQGTVEAHYCLAYDDGTQ